MGETIETVEKIVIPHKVYQDLMQLRDDIREAFLEQDYNHVKKAYKQISKMEAYLSFEVKETFIGTKDETEDDLPF